jgi:general secretion pathway protein C
MYRNDNRGTCLQARYPRMNLRKRVSEFSQLPTDRIVAQGVSVLPRVIAAAMALAIGWQLTQLVWVFLPYPAPNTSALKSIAPAPATQPGSSLGDTEISRLLNANLFGEAKQENNAVTPQEMDPSAAPDTTLSLELLGTIASESTEESFALIHERGKDTKVYAIGDNIARGARLHAVYTDSVLLDRGGKLEALRLPKEESGGSAQPRTSSLRTTKTLSKPTVANVIADNATRLTDVLRPQPVFADGQQRGYRLYPGRDRRTFAALGLRPGDLVTEINGTALNDPASGMEIFKSMGEATSVTVTIERNGQPEVLVLDMAALTALEEE